MFGDPLDLFGPNAHHATRLAALLLVCGVPLIGAAGTSAAADADEPTWQGVERIGPPVLFSPGVERYGFGSPDVTDPRFYPIPQGRVDRAVYMRWLEESGLLDLAGSPAQGMLGPQSFMPVLAKFVQTGDESLGLAIVAMLKDFHRAMQEEVRQEGWVWHFIEEPAFIPLYRRHLIAGGLMTEDEAWFRDLWLFYSRNLHVWASEPIEWRGGCHRSMPEAIAKGLAAQWYPDIPEAAHWRRHGELVLNDFWQHKDVPQNDTGYFPGPLLMLSCCGDEYLGDDRIFTDPGMARFWQRMMVEVTPDGAINPYGPNGGWNSTGALRIFWLEKAAALTRNGEYRYAAHKAMNYILYQTPSMRGDQYLMSRETGQHIALAWLCADDSVEPVCPPAGSLWNERAEAARIPHTDKAIIQERLGNADPDPHRGHACCSWALTGKLWPDKLVLRSGWSPGDLFALVELHPTSFPANPGGIMGLSRWGAPFTQVCSSKGASVENRLLIEDVSGMAERRYHPDSVRIDEEWRSGTMPDIQSELDYFSDTPEATFARLRVRNMDGLPVLYEREFVFAKNRFLATREILTFEESFEARVAPLWNAQNAGPQVGPHWANTFIGAPIGSNGQVEMATPPADLLVWFAPRPECRLQVVDRLEVDPRAEASRAQVRYLWEGEATRGQKLVFTQLLYPHQPYRFRASTNNPGAKASYADELQATACASGIRPTQDSPEATVLRVDVGEGPIEWVVFNPGKRSLDLNGAVCTEEFTYIRGGG